jgi:TATA-box binding protein (TBP) (component of TFIID and TFIIIB)
MCNSVNTDAQPEDTQSEVKITNLVATYKLVFLSYRQDISHAVVCLRGRYSRKVFPAATFRGVNPRCTTQLFTSGKVVTAGVTTKESSLVVQYIMQYRLMKECGIVCVLEDHVTQNVVGAARVNGTIDLAAFYANNTTLSGYKQGGFPGLQYRPKFKHIGFKNVTVTMFNSGSVLLSGGTSIDMLNRLYSKIKPDIMKYVTAPS